MTKVSLPEGLEFTQVILADDPAQPADPHNASQELDNDISGLIDLLTNPPDKVDDSLADDPKEGQQEPGAAPGSDRPAPDMGRIDAPKISPRILHSSRLQVRTFDLIATGLLTWLSGSFANYDQLKSAKKDLEELALIWAEICELENIKVSPYYSLFGAIAAIYTPAAIQAYSLRGQNNANKAAGAIQNQESSGNAIQQEKPARQPVMPRAPRQRGVKPGTVRGSYKKGGQKA